MKIISDKYLKQHETANSRHSSQANGDTNLWFQILDETHGPVDVWNSLMRSHFPDDGEETFFRRDVSQFAAHEDV